MHCFSVCGLTKWLMDWHQSTAWGLGSTALEDITF